MAREHDPDPMVNPIDDLYKQFRRHARVDSDLWNRLLHAPVLDHRRRVPVEPSEGMIVIDPVWFSEEHPSICFFVNGEWHCVYVRDPVKNIKVYGDRRNNVVREGAFRFNIEKDLDGHVITLVEGFNGTAGSGATTFNLSNQTRGTTILSTPCTIASGAYHDNGAATVDEGGDPENPNNRVWWKDRIWVDVSAVGSGSKGLGTYPVFSPFAEPLDEL